METPKRKQLDGKCVCQICTCGKDFCPPQQIKVDKSHFETTNKKDYKQWEMSKREKFSYTPAKIEFGNGSFQTSYNKDFIQYEHQAKQEKIVPLENFPISAQLTAQKGQDLGMSQMQFSAKQKQHQDSTPKRQQTKQSDYRYKQKSEHTPAYSASVKSEKDSNKSNQHKYIFKQQAQQEQQQQTLVRPGLEGKSEYNDKFLRHSQYVTPVKQNNYSYIQPSDAYKYASTTYKEEFIQKPIIQSQAIKPQDFLHTYKDLKEVNQSSYNQEYTPHKITKQSYYRPDDNNFNSGYQYEKKSLYQQEYGRYDQSAYKKEECPVRRLPSPFNTPSQNRHLIYSAQKNGWE